MLALAEDREVGEEDCTVLLSMFDGINLPDYYYYSSSYTIAISAIGPAPQAVTKNSEVEQNTGKLQHI